MQHQQCLSITAHLLALLSLTACDPGDDESGVAFEDGGEPVLAGSPEPMAPGESSALTQSSFAFQHHLAGGTWDHKCDFDDLHCHAVGKYHTGVDDAASKSTATRATNFGVRTLIQSMSANDHGMGNAVAVRYLLASGEYVYGTDNHMSSHHPLSTRPDGAVAIPRGAKLGNVGGSGKGDPNMWGDHAHHEMKIGNTFASPQNGLYWGYTPASAVQYGYSDPEDYLGTRRVLMPEFSLANSGWGDYDVLYGVVNTPIFSRIQIEGSKEVFSDVGVSGRLGWGDTVVDFPMDTNRAPGSYAVTRSRQFATAGDYRMNASVRVDGQWRAGYPVIFSVLPKSTDFIRDNDMGAASFKSGGLGVARFDGYGYGAAAAAGNSGAWAQWYAQRAGTFRLSVYVGGNGVGSVRFKIYPSGVGNPIYSDPVDLSSAVYGWVQLRVGATTSWKFTSSGYVGLSANTGVASEVFLFDAIKFTSL